MSRNKYYILYFADGKIICINISMIAVLKENLKSHK